MLEITGDIWRYQDKAVIAITTNGNVSKAGKAVFGNGVARQAVQRFPNIAELLGSMMLEGGNHVYNLGCGIVSFPVEETPWSLPDLRIIERSAMELRALADTSGWPLIIVPRPGCGGGGLAWHDVKPLLLSSFDDRFIVVTV